VGNVKPPRPTALTALVVLVALAMTMAALPPSPLTMLLGTIFVALLASELDRSGRHLGLWIVRAAAYLLPARVRTDAQAEWTDHVLSAGDAGMRPVLAAISIALLGAPRLALSYRFRLRAAKWASELLSAYFESWQSMLEGFTAALDHHLENDVLDSPTQTNQQSFLRATWVMLSAVAAYGAATAMGLIACANVPLVLIPRIRWAQRPTWLLTTSGTLGWLGLITLTCLASSPAIWVPCVTAMGLCTVASVATLGAVVAGPPGLMLRPVLWILGPVYRAELEDEQPKS
jgi:hypothetical protein